MAWIEKKQRRDGGVSARVVWRLGGGRDGNYQCETFSAGTDPLTAPPRFIDSGEEYVRQIVDLSPGQRKRYLGHLKVLGETQVRDSLLFTKPVTSITEADLKDWLIGWDRSRKTKATIPGSSTGSSPRS